MRVKFRRSARYSEDGYEVKQAEKNEVRDVAHSTACALICAKVADRSDYPPLGKTDIRNID